MQVAQLAIFSSVMAILAIAGGFCLYFGTYGFYKLKTNQSTEVKIGSHFTIKTPSPALVLCFFGLILFLTIEWMVNDKIQIARLTTTVSDQSGEIAALQKNDQLSAALPRVAAGELAGGDVSGVKSDLEGTKNDLNMARSELGTLIARNHEQIDMLRRLGERDYFEFAIQTGKAQKVGNVTVRLTSANAKKNQFSVAMTVEGTLVSKKNRTINEPIFFYTKGSHAPEELVVNRVTKNIASGYVSVPKVANSRAGTPD